MASIYSLKPGELFEVPIDDKITECKLCLNVAAPSDGIDLGPLYQYGKPIEDSNDVEIYCAHYFCLLFAPGLEQGGTDEEGIKGFLPNDILKEWRRGSRLKCQYCEKKYATIGCCHKSCKKTYHLACGLRNGSLLQFCDTYDSYCSDHRPVQEVHKSKDKSIFEAERECGVCFDIMKPIKKLNEKQKRQSLWSPCCNKWFHLPCIQKLAVNSGYFFKCPMCNNKDEFEAEMKKFGIYIPEQDAAWEREGNIYDGIYERHGTCDAENCLCPDGRTFDEDYTIWEIILCKYCGAQGMHVQCGNLPLKDDVTWKCPPCHEMIIKMPPRAKHNFRKIQQMKKSSQRNVLAKLLTKSRITISSDLGEQINLSSSSLSARVKVCPKFEIPKPVKLGPRPEEEEEYKDIAIQTIEKIVQEKASLKPILKIPKMEVLPEEININEKESITSSSDDDLEKDEPKHKQTANTENMLKDKESTTKGKNDDMESEEYKCKQTAVDDVKCKQTTDDDNCKQTADSVDEDEVMEELFRPKCKQTTDNDKCKQTADSDDEDEEMEELFRSKCKQTAENVRNKESKSKQTAENNVKKKESKCEQTADNNVAVLTDNLNILNNQNRTVISPKKKNMGCKRKLQLEVLEDDEGEVSAKMSCLNKDSEEEEEEEKSNKMKQNSILNYFNTRPTNSCA